MNRRDFLLGALAGAFTGVGVARLADGVLERETRPSQAPEVFRDARPSFAQQGEDLILQSIFSHLEIEEPSYIDIGAFDPIKSNNTYALYLAGSRGVLVEPNPFYFERLKAVRGEDIVLNIGVGVTDQKQAPYYIVRGEGQLNTFSKRQAERYKRLLGPGAIEKVIRMPTVNVNTILEEHFSSGPNLLSIDVEGLDLSILKTLDFSRFRPEVFCVETLIVGSKKLNQAMVDFMLEKGYSIRGGTFVNTIFVDDRVLATV
jgi:FkbM family methyltransferase